MIATIYNASAWNIEILSNELLDSMITEISERWIAQLSAVPCSNSYRTFKKQRYQIF